MKVQQIILLVVIAAALVFFGISLGANSSSYADFGLAKKTGKTIHVAGEWVQREKVVEEPNRFQFYVQDSLKNTEWVTYYDPKPSNFDQAEKVVLIGRYEDEGFVANEIVTKCPSKYEAEEPKLE